MLLGPPTVPSSSRFSFIPLPIYICLFCLLWSLSFVASKIGVTDCPPLILLTARFADSGAVILAISAVRRERLTLSRHDMAVFAAIGIANNALFLASAMSGFKPYPPDSRV
jgi:drug/metabolite transporter (DMT)-like permease